MKVRQATPADKAEWLRMRLALWPSGTAVSHRRSGTRPTAMAGDTAT